MRFIEFINESDIALDFDSINMLIHRDCKKYLNLIQHKDPLYRGMSTYDHIGIKDVRKDRESKGMSEEEAKYFNDWLHKNGHNRRDQAVMCTSSESHTLMFGPPFWIFPRDPMSYTWIHTPDINITTSMQGWDSFTIGEWISKEKGLEYNKDILNKLKMPFEYYFSTDEGFWTAYDKQFEMWIKCDKYFYVNSGKYNWDKTNQRVFK
jgi:hypothetical protein